MRILARGGHHVVHHADGKRALKDFVESPTQFDLVFLDVNLPGLIGTDLAEEIRKSGYAGPMLLMSGRVTGEVRQVGEKVGAAAIIEKPFDLEQLTAVLNSLGVIVGSIDAAAQDPGLP